MKALYTMQYAAQMDAGVGAVYIGDGTILGVDIANNRLEGSYVEEGGRITATATITGGPGGGDLVTGDHLPEGHSLPIKADWPSHFANGRDHVATVGGKTVHVILEKVGDIP